jgi:hypothetical protein
MMSCFTELLKFGGFFEGLLDSSRSFITESLKRRTAPWFSMLHAGSSVELGFV